MTGKSWRVGELNIREGTLNGIYKEKASSGYATVQREWAMWGKQMEKTLPGYGEQNEALHWMVRILTGVRVLYCLFYLIMTFVYGMEKTNAVMTLLGPFIFMAGICLCCGRARCLRC